MAIDLRRYDAWVVNAARMAHDQKATIIAVADSVLSPLGAYAAHVLVVSAAGAGPFDSHVGTLALFNVLIAGAAEKLRHSASERLSQAEAAWHHSGVLVDK